ncbi:hypothetical protein [Saccharothrix coeruleofusca]|uniref:MFS transporter n=1 Tax=Saccharothrix coeruleofusca TaxID=33919 RepID=A0A918AR61_9PSEU|nr:hypothetical protein [Saccharothrix coeruleofusca]MBP2337365.1 hypothetical protein [Saccharothrix coeruleofusca]GGP72422.1 hypothetical protein GCM10010185_52100 [Saccharothrix coeruleofusca]
MVIPAPALFDTSRRRIGPSGFLDTTIEYYSFLLRGTAAMIVFDELFFPDPDPVLGAIAALASLVAWLAGGLVFDHFGDKCGREQALIITTGVAGTLPVLPGTRVVRGEGGDGAQAGGGAVAASHQHQPLGGPFGADPDLFPGPARAVGQGGGAPGQPVRGTAPSSVCRPRRRCPAGGRAPFPIPRGPARGAGVASGRVAARMPSRRAPKAS